MKSRALLIIASLSVLFGFIAPGSSPISASVAPEVVPITQTFVVRPETSSSAAGCTVTWQSNSATIGFSCGNIPSPWRSAKATGRCVHIDGSPTHYVSTAWLNDYQGPVFKNCNNSLLYDVKSVSITVSTSYL